MLTFETTKNRSGTANFFKKLCFRLIKSNLEARQFIKNDAEACYLSMQARYFFTFPSRIQLPT